MVAVADHAVDLGEVGAVLVDRRDQFEYHPPALASSMVWLIALLLES